jgi:hypothetical protein
MPFGSFAPISGVKSFADLVELQRPWLDVMSSEGQHIVRQQRQRVANGRGGSDALTLGAG